VSLISTKGMIYWSWDLGFVPVSYSLSSGTSRFGPGSCGLCSGIYGFGLESSGLCLGILGRSNYMCSGSMVWGGTSVSRGGN
jgi:hypothetical protein